MTEADVPTRSRRRGATLEHALHMAAVVEIAEVGYPGLTMEGVAARARTGKAAVYRRWPNKHALALDALRYVLPPLPEVDPHACVRENLRRAFTALCEVFAGKTDFPEIAIVLGLLGDEQLRATFVDAIVAPRMTSIRAILDQAERNGEFAPGTLAPLAGQTGPALIIQSFMLTGTAPTEAGIADIVDTVLAGTSS